MSISVQHLSYIHPDKEILFGDISFSIGDRQKVGLVGDNGSGKSTLLQIVGGLLHPSAGEIVNMSSLYYIPQHFGQYNNRSVAEALGIDVRLKALHLILEGNTSDENFTALADEWDIEERALSALREWGLEHIALSGKLSALSGGEKTRIFLSGIAIHKPDIVLMDEPTNHLDHTSRKKLYDMVSTFKGGLLIVSHDRTLLNLLPEIYELGRDSIEYYAGNYEFYKSEKEQKLHSLMEKLDEKEKELRLAKKMAREALERKQKHEVRGKKNNLKKGIGKMAMDTIQDKAEKSTSRLKDVHTNKMSGISESMTQIRASIPDARSMKVDFNTSSLHTGKILITACDVNFGYSEKLLWHPSLNFQIKSGERVLIRGGNGSGKSTLVQLLTGGLSPVQGVLDVADFSYVHLDQEYSIIDDNLTVLQQAQSFNRGLYEHEVKTILNRFLFSEGSWGKLCAKLSGGEKMKLALSCLMIGANTPDVFILDEPTNNIDIRNVEILTTTLKDYRGTVLLISHDEYFAEQIGIDYSIDLQLGKE